MSAKTPGFTVRIKLVDLNRTERPGKRETPRSAAGAISALVGSGGERSLRPKTAETEACQTFHSTGEVCLNTGRLIPPSQFEDHLEECLLCSNRVELQLDFIETLQVAIYQRNAKPNSDKVRGAMLISTPEMNFAVCGEIELY